MGFYDLLQEWPGEKVDAAIKESSARDVRLALERERPGPAELAALLSPLAATTLESMAHKASLLTMRHFGRTIQLFTPLYLSDHCTNHCRYCGFNNQQSGQRRQLTMDEIRAEAKTIAATGLRQVLVLTGDARHIATLEYLEQAVGVLRDYFPAIVLEIYALSRAEYARLIEAGAEGLTIYQETYDQDVYALMHPAGPKRDYHFRLNAPERGCQAGMRWVGISALYGLGDWRKDAFWTALHGRWLQDRYPGVEIGLSVPRMRPHAGQWQPEQTVTDRELTQILLAQRLYLPRAAITVSTRESAAFRDNLLPLGVTRFSAGVCTAVGGHAAPQDSRPQFDVNDTRDVPEIRRMLVTKGWQPVFKDWQPLDMGKP